MGFGKKGQFFILSAVIIAAIIVGFASVRNDVTTGEAPKKFYYYSQQLEQETGAVVDYALYNGENGPIQDFLQKAIFSTTASYPDMEIYACYSDPADQTKLICQNNGTNSIIIYAGGQVLRLNASRATTGVTQTQIIFGTTCISGACYASGSFEPIPDYNCVGRNDGDQCISSQSGTSTGCSGSCSGNFSISSLNNITLQTNSGHNYSVTIRNPAIQTNQFYFIFRINTTSGEFVDVSK